MKKILYIILGLLGIVIVGLGYIAKQVFNLSIENNWKENEKF